MSGRFDDTYNDEWLLEGSPADMRRQNMRALDMNGDLAALTTQVMRSVAIALQPGDLVTNITFKSGATAADTPTNWWVALYSSAATPALLSQSADQTTTAWAANTVKTVALATPQRITTAGVYYAAIMMKATATVSLIGADVGIAGAAAAILSSKILSQTSGSSLTDTAPATITSATTSDLVPFCVIT